MSLSALGSLLVLGGFGAGGFLIARGISRRPGELAALQSALHVLLTEIDFGLTPLGEAMEQAARVSDGPVSQLFSTAAAHLARGRGETPGEAWRRALDEVRGALAITPDDGEVLAALGPCLGSTDRHHQRRHIELCITRLAIAEEDARTQARQGVRLYRSLGIIIGGLLVALLS